jgi:hypothetical protein
VFEVQKEEEKRKRTMVATSLLLQSELACVTTGSGLHKRLQVNKRMH